MKVFLDTNVLAAAFATRGLCSDVMREVLENHELVTSRPILTELRRILSKKFKVPGPQCGEIVDLVGTSAIVSEPTSGASFAIDDVDDVPHLSAACNASCDVFVTGDKALWEVNAVGDMKVLSPRAFWELISGPTR